MTNKEPIEPIEPTEPMEHAPVDSGAEPKSQPAGGSRTYTKEEMDAVIKRRIDKQNAKHAEKVEDLEKQLVDFEASASEAREKLAEFERKEQRREAAASVAKQTGLTPTQVELLSGDTEDELLASANAFKSASPNPYPVIKGDGGDPIPPAVTKEEIFAIKNREERIKAMGANPELFRN